MNSPDTIGCFSKSFLSWWQYPHWDSEKDGIILKSKVNYWRKQEKKKKANHIGPVVLVSDWSNIADMLQYWPMKYEKTFLDCLGNDFFFPFYWGREMTVCNGWNCSNHLPVMTWVTLTYWELQGILYVKVILPDVRRDNFLLEEFFSCCCCSWVRIFCDLKFKT